MSGTVGFLIAVGGVSAILYWLMTRAENRAASRSSGGAGSDYSSDSSSIGGWSLTQLVLEQQFLVRQFQLFERLRQLG